MYAQHHPPPNFVVSFKIKDKGLNKDQYIVLNQYWQLCFIHENHA